MSMLAYWSVLILGVVLGFGLAAILVAGKIADLESDRAHWERIAHNQTLKAIMGRIQARPPDDGRRLMDEIARAVQRPEVER